MDSVDRWAILQTMGRISRRTFAETVALGAGALESMAQSVAPQARESYISASPVNVGTDAQLFVDQVLVRSSTNVAFTLHPARKHPGNPLVVADRPWEGWRLEIFGSVIYDAEEKLYKMWYIAEPLGAFGPARKGPSADNPTCYATSQDGVHWEKPLVGLQSNQGEKTNALLYATHLASVTKDLQEPDARRRYKMTCYVHEPAEVRGYNSMVSPDGLHWTLRSQASRICPGADVITSYYDKRRKLWVALGKIGTQIRGHNRRVFYAITSSDFENWSAPELAIFPDLQDDAGSLARIEQVRPMLDVPDNPAEMRTEFYGSGFYPAESCTLALPWVFTINNKARYGNQEGPFELQLAVTRDLKNWQRPFRVPCVPRGDPDDWECGIQQTASCAIRVGDEVWLYYCGANYTHGTPVLYRERDPERKRRFTSSIGLATWKLDRFVSADGAGPDAQFCTVPLTFTGDVLELNAATKGSGSIRVEILDAAGRPIAGLAPSLPFRGDELRARILWPEQSSPARWKARPVSLRFQLDQAELYSFAFRRA